MAKRPVIIIGNAGAARECYWILRKVMQEKEEITFKGFLSFEGYSGNLRELVHLELGSDDDYTSQGDEFFIIGIGSPVIRAKVWAKWKERKANFMNLIHPACFIPDEICLGEGNIITQACSFSCNVTVGDANYFNGGVVVGHDAHIGSANFFGTYSLLAGNTVVGSRNSFGVGAVVLESAKIGNNNTIAPGAFIYKGCGDNTIMAGNPALRVDV